MYKLLKKLSVFLIIIAATPALAIPIISVKATPDRLNGLLPANVTVDINISGIHTSDPNALLGGFQFDLTYDPNFLYLPAGRIGFGTALGVVRNNLEAIGFTDSSTPCTITPSLCTIKFYEVSLLESSLLEPRQQSDTFKLATLVFASQPQNLSSFPDLGNIGLGNLFTHVSLKNIVLSDALGNSLGFAPSITSATITFVPEPTIFGLLVLGAIGIGFTGRRSKEF
jgi:hypothetical protein